ncbi:MAG: hypothetical protein Q8N01_10340 [Sulfuricurvum sp.]|nr:hypothetical protein [Sulfuricurvum sp.]MDP3022320.1 hypothetical protein [Sulfuricurvum sp.]MDP3120804.1 hypothetical protein [Sulfuricurvum sp.]
MIKLIALLFTITIANANIFPFLLPDEGSRFNHYLQKHLKNSQKEIIILTPSLNYPSLSKSILRSISHGIHLNLIVSKPSGDALRFIAYEGVTLYSYTPRDLTDTLILIDNSLVCHLSGSLNEKSLSENVSSVWCSDESLLVLAAQKQITTLLKRSKSYLQ